MNGTTLLTRNELHRLATAADGSRVSIYLPTHRAGRETSQDPIRLKNLLGAAEEDMIAQGLRAATAREILAPGKALLDDRDFWLHQGDGLAVFLAADEARLFRLPAAVRELEVVTDHYHVKPLIALVSGDGRYYVLAISLHRVRLFQASRDRIREIDLGDVPNELRDAVGYDWEERSLQFHTGTGADAGGTRRAMFHGQGSPEDDEGAEIERFLRLVDDGVTRLLQHDPAPIVLAGVEHVAAAYRSLTQMRHVLPEGIDGNPDRVSADELRERAWSVVEPLVAARQREATKRFAELAATERTDDRLEHVVRAASEGRIETLFTALGTQRWGRFDPATLRVDLHEVRQPGDRDLLDLAAVESLMTGAEVYAIAPARVPGGGVIAAINRY